ncbi:WecB/TagA/CpsF family glycosyltransferase [Azospirillum sp.]|uniref:WecB/TagA/CpsF family glycosyltransferase n=1 Tax=Azospirillum sp. TaxID=34012 RepID=UPI002D424BA5|nr:WecB/TagA/CpsF family glycosyltransferase [Azospirillum sp.]HYD71321.1 WecB/TagA/CpsF family glycosyltransferase [Azospirillum sp.]
MVDRVHPVDIAGCYVHPCTQDELLAVIAQSVEERRTLILSSLNLHALYVRDRKPAFRALQADPRTMVRIDGMSVVLLARTLGHKLRFAHRTAWIDWFPDLMDMVEARGWRLFYLGAGQEVQDRGLDWIRQRCPGIVVDGHHGYFDMRPDGPENRAVLARIDAFRPHILLVGMGMGRQEQWIRDNIDRLPAHCVATCGACLEYFAGVVPTPPRALGPLGLEWAYRFASNPRRFWRRYLVEPWSVAAIVARHALATRRRAADGETRH